MARYAMVNSDGNVTNICQWDGVSEWSAPDGIILVECDDEPDAERGGTYIDGVFTRAQVPVVDDPSIADQVAAMQAQLAALLAKVE